MRGLAGFNRGDGEGEQIHFFTGWIVFQKPLFQFALNLSSTKKSQSTSDANSISRVRIPAKLSCLIFLLLCSLETATLLRNSKIFAMLKQGGKS